MTVGAFGSELRLRLLGDDAVAAARRAAALGFVRFDAAGAAPADGAWGVEEAARLGAALRGTGSLDAIRGAGPDAAPILRAGPPDGRFAPRAFIRGVEDLLNAVGVPRLALALPSVWMSRWERGPAAVLAELRGVGAVPRVGFLAPDADAARRALELDGVDFLRGPAGILEHRFQDAGVFEAAAERGVEVLVTTPMAGGLLWLGPGQGAEPGSATERALTALDRLAAAAGLDRAALGLAYLSGLPGRVSAVVECPGAGLPERLARSCALLDVPRPAGWARELVGATRRELRTVSRTVSRAGN